MRNKTPNAEQPAPGLAHAQRAGFSLVELLTVIAVLSILTAILIPQFEPTIHDQLEATAQVVSSELLYGRQLAVTNNSNYRFTLEQIENRLLLRHVGTNTAFHVLPPSPFAKSNASVTEQQLDLDELPRAGATVKLLAMYRGGNVSRPITELEFGSLGQTVQTEPTVLWLGCGTGSNRRYLSLTVAPVTGLVTIGDFQGLPPTEELATL